MRLRRLIVGAALAATAALAAGCADACFQIQQTLCECRGQTQDERNSCEATLSTQESIQPPTEAQLKVCAQLLPGCQKAINNGKSCEALQDVPGRQACGIAEK
jgi:hypothetical protein